MLPYAALGAIGFADAEMGDFLIERGREGPFLVGGVGDLLYAVMLEGRFEGHAIPLRSDQIRSGLVIRGLTLEVDHASWTDDERVIGVVLCGGGRALMVAQTRIGVFDEVIRVGLSTPSLPDECIVGLAAFTRWALVHRDEVGARHVVYERNR